MAEEPQLVLSTSCQFPCLFWDLLKTILIHAGYNYDLQHQASCLQKEKTHVSSWNGVIREGKGSRMNEK